MKRRREKSRAPILAAGGIVVRGGREPLIAIVLLGSCHDRLLSHLRGLSGSALHYFYEATQFLVDLPQLMGGKLRGIGDTLFCAGHLFVPNVRHEGAVEKRPIAVANCISSCVVCLCLGHLVSPCLLWNREHKSPFRVSGEPAVAPGDCSWEDIVAGLGRASV
jgi:hypothetical protein